MSPPRSGAALQTFGFLLQPIQQSQKSVEDRQRMRWTPGDVEINGTHGGRAIQNLWIANERSASDGACPDGDGDFWFRHSSPGFPQGQFHAFRNAAGDQQSIRVAWGRHKLNAEPTEVPADCAENIRVGLAGIATTGAHLAQAQGTTKEFEQLSVQGG